MNIQLEKLQRKPTINSFRPVTVKLNKRDKLNELTTPIDMDDTDTEKKKVSKFEQRILDKTDLNVDRTELLKKFRQTSLMPVSRITKKQPISVQNFIPPSTPIPSQAELEKKMKY